MYFLFGKPVKLSWFTAYSSSDSIFLRYVISWQIIILLESFPKDITSAWKKTSLFSKFFALKILLIEFKSDLFSLEWKNSEKCFPIKSTLLSAKNLLQALFTSFIIPFLSILKPISFLLIAL